MCKKHSADLDVKPKKLQDVVANNIEHTRGCVQAAVVTTDTKTEFNQHIDNSKKPAINIRHLQG